MNAVSSTPGSPPTPNDWRLEPASGSLPDSLSIVRSVADQVVALHEAGRLHLRICLDSLQSPAERPLLSAPSPTRRLTRASHGTAELPRELQDILPIELSTDLPSARQTLRDLRVSLDPQQIDVFQLGTLACQLVAQAGAREYLCSARVKARVPAALRPLLERCWGIDQRPRYQSAMEFRDELQRLAECSTPVAGPPSADAGSGTPDTAESNPSPTPNSAVRSAIETAADTAPLSRLGPYEVRQRIGGGGMGDVYLGYDPVLGRHVAVKVLPAELARHSDFVKRFYAEASAAARVTHPNVIPIHFIGEEEGRHFFVMPYIEGESLAGRLSREGRFAAEEALLIVDDVLAGLQAAHAQGLIHRDIKPGNVLLEAPLGRAVVADFGLVKSLGEAGGRTATGVVLGTVDYMAPEQGRGRAVDHRCDLYAVGVLLYQLLSGRLPFVADSPTGMIFQHVYERPTPLPELIPGLAAPLWTVIARLMAKSPEARYGSAQAVRDDLRAVRQGQPLPSGTERIDPEAYWRPTVNRPDDRPLTMIVEHPAFDVDPEEPLLTPGVGWWGRLVCMWHDWWAARRPEWMAALETTQQQADGAIAEYQRRRDQLKAFVREAESVLADLNAQRGRAPDAANLSGLIGGQADELDMMRLKLAQVEATLGRLRLQRDLLNARLKAAKAKAQIHQGVTVQSRRFLQIPSAAQIVVLIVLLGVLGLTLRARWPVIQELIAGFETKPLFVNRPTASTPTLAPNTKPVGKAPTTERCLAVSRDGLMAITAQFSSSTPTVAGGHVNRGSAEIKAWDLFSGTEALSFEDPHCSQDLALSPDRTTLLSVGHDCQSGDGELRVWNTKDGRLIHRLQAAMPAKASGAGFSSDGTRAFAVTGGLQTQQLTMLELDGGKTSNLSMPQAGDRITSVAISPTSDIAAIGVMQHGYSGRIAIDIHNLRQRRLSTSIPCSAKVQRLAYSADGRLLAASEWGAIRIYETENWSVVASLPTEKSSTIALSLSQDGAFVAALWDRHVQVWNVATKSPVAINSQTDALDLAFGSEGTLVVLPGSSRFSFFDAETGKELLGIKRPRGSSD